MNKNAQYQQTFRARKLEQGTPEVRGIYALRPLHAKIKAYAAKLARTKGGGP